MLEIRALSGREARSEIGALAQVLLDCIDGGASVSFMAGFSQAAAEGFFAGVIDGVERGERILLAAFTDSQLVGTVQVILATPPNNRIGPTSPNYWWPVALAGKVSPAA